MIPAKLLIVIVNYRTPALAVDAVASLEQEVCARGDTHVVVVENGSGDDSAATIGAAIATRGFGDWCTLLPMADNRGFAAGNNAGLRWYRDATGTVPRYAWLLNPDTRAHAGAASALVAFLEAHPAAGIAGGRCVWEEGGLRNTAFRFQSPVSELIAALQFGPVSQLLRRHGVTLPIPDVPVRVDWVSGSSLMIRGAVIERIGLMDEGYFLYFEESDYCSRADAAGFETWSVPASVITHIGGQATGVTGQDRSRNRRPRYWFHSRARFLVRRHGVARAHLANLLWLAGYPIGSLLAFVRRIDRNQPPRLWRDFLTCNYGPGGIMYHTKELRQ